MRPVVTSFRLEKGRGQRLWHGTGVTTQWSSGTQVPLVLPLLCVFHLASATAALLVSVAMTTPATTSLLRTGSGRVGSGSRGSRELSDPFYRVLPEVMPHKFCFYLIGYPPPQRSLGSAVFQLGDLPPRMK